MKQFFFALPLLIFIGCSVIQVPEPVVAKLDIQNLEEIEKSGQFQLTVNININNQEDTIDLGTAWGLGILPMGSIKISRAALAELALYEIKSKLILKYYNKNSAAIVNATIENIECSIYDYIFKRKIRCRINDKRQCEYSMYYTMPTGKTVLFALRQSFMWCEF